MSKRAIASADGRVQAAHPHLAVVGIAVIVVVSLIILTLEHIAGQGGNLSVFRGEPPLPPAVRDQVQKVARLLYVPGEAPDIADSACVQPFCITDFTTADGAPVHLTLDRKTGRLVGFSCRASFATVRLLERQGAVRTPQEAVLRARNYLAVLFPEEAQSVLAKVDENAMTAWHVVLKNRTDDFVIMIHAPTGALLLVNRYQYNSNSDSRAESPAPSP